MATEIVHRDLKPPNMIAISKSIAANESRHTVHWNDFIELQPAVRQQGLDQQQRAFCREN